MARYYVRQLVRTQLTYQIHHRIRRGDNDDVIYGWLKREYPETHGQTLRALIYRVRQSMAAAEAYEASVAAGVSLPTNIPRFEGFEHPHPMFEHKKYHMLVRAELKTYRGRTSYYRTFKLAFDSVPSPNDVMQLISEIVAGERQYHHYGSPPQGTRFTRVVSVDFQMLFRR